MNRNGINRGSVISAILIIWAFSLIGLNLLNAQSPQALPYQALAIDDKGVLLVNQNVGYRIGIWRTDPVSGTNVYTETHNLATDQFGIVSLDIGGGGVINGDFASIDWSNGPYYVKIEMDASGGTGYLLMGSSQLLSVPYTLHAETAAGIDGSETKVNAGALVSVSGSGTSASPYLISTTADGSETKLSAGTSVSISGSGTTGTPYLVNAVPDGSETKVSAGTLISVSGAGTSGSPYQISSTVNGSETKVNAGINIGVTGSGTTGSPYVIASTYDGSETKVNAGTYASVSGSGTIASPYVINAAPDGSETKINAGTLISVSGSGTTGSPYSLSSPVTGSETKINAGTNVSVSGSGTSGSPYVISATHDGSETKVSAGSNTVIPGSGTVASPYVINATGAPMDPSTNFQIFDEFLGGGLMANNSHMIAVGQKQEGLGALGWVFDWFNSSSSATPVFGSNTASPPYLGEYKLSLDGTGSYTAFYLPSICPGTTPGFTVEFVMKQGQVGTSGGSSDFKIRLGLLSSFNQVGDPTNGIFFYASGSAAWQAISRNPANPGNPWTVNTAVSQSTNYRKFRLVFNSTLNRVEFYIDNMTTPRATIDNVSNRLPTASLGVGIHIEGVSLSGVNSFFLDYFRMSIKGISR